MTLETLITILNLNDCFKDSDESVKVTAINQVLNDLEIDNLLDGTDALNFNFQVQRFHNLTYKQLNETLNLELTEEQILALFQYTINEISNENPLEVAFQTSIITDNVNRPARLNYQANWNIPKIVTANSIINRLGYRATAKLVIKTPLTQILGVNYLATAKLVIKTPITQILGINYLATYNKNLVRDINQLMTLGYNCTYRKQDLSQSIVSGVNYSATYSIL